MMLKGKCIIVGISGGIAAYKSPEFVRRLITLGAKVRVIMTPSAHEFITPLTLQAVSNNTVSTDLLDLKAERAMEHIELAKWADLIIIAPATADFIARLQVGMANDLLTTVCLATAALIAIAPAMNQQMYRAKVTQYNLSQLIDRGVHCLGPASGEQACGDIGLGRMLEPQQLADEVAKLLCCNCDLQGINILLTAGPTQEPIDPVRFITNRSSGKMGFAIAEAAASRGAKVTLISGPVNLPTPCQVERINVITANEMLNQVLTHIKQHTIFIACAAVADYRMATVATNKIKKQGDELSLTLIKNPDIVATVAEIKENRPFVVGFAAETENIEHYARKKLFEKNLDMICANDVSQSDRGFGSDKNALHLYWKTGDKALSISDKHLLAQQLIDEIKKQYESNRH